MFIPLSDWSIESLVGALDMFTPWSLLFPFIPAPLSDWSIDGHFVLMIWGGNGERCDAIDIVSVRLFVLSLCFGEWVETRSPDE